MSLGKLVLAVAGMATVTACGGGGSTAGQPTSPPTTEAPRSTTTTSSTQRAPVSDFTNTQLCELLTAEQAVLLGGSAEGKPSYGVSTGHPVCQWSDFVSLNIDFGKDTRSSQAPTGEGITNTPTEVAGRTAVLSHKAGVREFCQVIVDVTETATMAFGSGVHDKGKGKYEPCEVARQLATVVVTKING